MQRYLWQQADGKRHVYDTNDQYPARAGQTLDVLCGETVTVRTQDMRPGMWFDPECPVCTIALAHALKWPVRELAQLAQRFDWTNDQITRLATALHWTPREVTELVGPREVASR